MEAEIPASALKKQIVNLKWQIDELFYEKNKQDEGYEGAERQEFER